MSTPLSAVRSVGLFCRGLGYEPPVICTPEALLEEKADATGPDR